MEDGSGADAKQGNFKVFGAPFGEVAVLEGQLASKSEAAQQLGAWEVLSSLGLGLGLRMR